jgi:hypothetical protein
MMSLAIQMSSERFPTSFSACAARPGWTPGQVNSVKIDPSRIVILLYIHGLDEEDVCGIRLLQGSTLSQLLQVPDIPLLS